MMLLCLLPLVQGCATDHAVSNDTSTKPSTFSKQDMVRSSLDNLIDAYQNKQISRFMALVADNYTGDSMILDSAVRRDFSRFHNISIRYTVNNITFDSSAAKAYVGITYTRSEQIIKTTKMVTRTGSTNFVLKLENGTYKLYSMGRATLFGVSH